MDQHQWNSFWSQNITQVEQFSLFLAKTNISWLSIMWWRKLYSALGSTCLTIKKRYPPYIAGLSSWIHASFLALLLLLCQELWSRSFSVHWSKRWRETTFPLQDFSQLNIQKSSTALPIHIFLGYCFTRGKHRTENEPVRKRGRTKQRNKSGQKYSSLTKNTAEVRQTLSKLRLHYCGQSQHQLSSLSFSQKSLMFLKHKI